MRRSLWAELLKLATTRALYGLLVGEVAVVLLTAASTVASSKADALTGSIHDQVLFLLVSINVGLFSLIIGMRTDRHGTILHAFLSDPKRRKTLLAKGAATAIAAVALAITALGAMMLVALPLASAKGGSLSVSGSDFTAAIGFLLANALWAVIGVGIGSVVRHQVATIVGGVVWVLVIENLGSGFLGDTGAYLPGQAAYALSHAEANGSALEATPAAAVMGTYAVLVFLLGLLATRRRDVG